MQYLLDTHVCIWAIGAKERLSPKVREIIQYGDNEIVVSQVTFFEIAIKLKIGKLPDFESTVAQFINAVSSSGFRILPVKDEHLMAYTLFDFHGEHRDPFDRYLIATAQLEKMIMISKDEKFKLYTNQVEIVW